MGEVVLVTARLELRRIVPDDIDRQLRLLNTPSVMKHLGGVKTREQVAEKHARTQALWQSDGFGFMMMWERDTGEMVGHCGMKRVDNPLAANIGDHEIGWLVCEERWRRGYAHEAMSAVVDWAFLQHGAPHLVALTSLANRGSWRLMEKLGMERRADLDFTDPAFPPADNPMIQYSLNQEQWEAQS
ncbi:GNAT family N-acetyltransferase [Erythrobacter sanguineus]|uniref:Protein N-acetyltransferase, RimJ/RimL family n=1 Tax=Erythrobacter sanguineus TaxID=198312 RepID=A0A1M7SUQ2_9SPHN|nr:GNAT family N-acetyltransferase [Erythrobacter sanguineus]SHN62215.1 Protein N-acetyltransferase, RimJ/RimL family [Erythrobacter sanguineus]